MNNYDVRSPEQALSYMVDCTLATVCDLASKKSRNKSEFTRQKQMAQRGVDWMVSMKIDCSGTRAADVVKVGSVAIWAEQFMDESEHLKFSAVMPSENNKKISRLIKERM